MAKVKKEFYQKPTIKVVEFDLNKAICNNVATMSTCLKIDQETGKKKTFISEAWKKQRKECK